MQQSKNPKNAGRKEIPAEEKLEQCRPSFKNKIYEFYGGKKEVEKMLKSYLDKRHLIDSGECSENNL